MLRGDCVVRGVALTEVLGQMLIPSKDIWRIRTRWTVIVLLKNKRVYRLSRREVLAVKTTRSFLVESEDIDVGRPGIKV